MSEYPIPDAVLVHHAAFLGKTRSGKTSSAKTAVERFVAVGERVCILDPIKSDWWGMTSSPNGKKAGLPFQILGGPHGHAPLHDTSGKVIGELVANGTLPLSIIDMAWFKGGGLQRFFCDFAETLMRKQRGVLHLVIEEAHEFAPKERSGIGDENMAIHWAKKLATAGGSKGIRLIVATQRTQALHNALLGSCETMVAHRLTAPADQKPVIDWLKANVQKDLATEIAQSLAGLPTGTAWVCSGEAQMFAKVAFPRIKTFDNSATPMSDDEAAKVATAPVNVDALRKLIGDAVAEAQANDPAALRRELGAEKAKVAQLEREAAKVKPAEAVDIQAAVTAAEARGIQIGFDRAVQALADARPTAAHAAPGTRPARFSSPKVAEAYEKAIVPIPAKVAYVAQPPGMSSLPPGETAILIAAVQYGTVDRDQLSVLTGYKQSSRNAYILRLSQKGLVTVSGQSISPTDAARDALGDAYQPLPTGKALQDYWMGKLPPGEAAILQCCVDAHPRAVERDEISAATGYKTSSRNAYIQRLKARRLVEPQGSAVLASATLF